MSMDDEQVAVFGDQQLDEVDADVLADIAAVYGHVDPVPAGLVEQVQFALTLDALHAEIAELQRESAGSAALAGVRSAQTDSQTVTFTSSTLTTMVTITPTSADRVRIDGWIAPGGGVRVELRLPDARPQTVADANGRFVFADVPRGLAQFVLEAPGADAPVLTPSIVL